MQLNKLAAALAVMGLAAPSLALATNGMVMEGYGPIAAAMGGAAMAYDNGTAALANNPATLGLSAFEAGLEVHPRVVESAIRQHVFRGVGFVAVGLELVANLAGLQVERAQPAVVRAEVDDIAGNRRR